MKSTVFVCCTYMATPSPDGSISFPPKAAMMIPTTTTATTTALLCVCVCTALSVSLYGRRINEGRWMGYILFPYSSFSGPMASLLNGTFPPNDANKKRETLLIASPLNIVVLYQLQVNFYLPIPLCSSCWRAQKAKFSNLNVINRDWKKSFLVENSSLSICVSFASKLSLPNWKREMRERVGCYCSSSNHYKQIWYHSE